MDCQNEGLYCIFSKILSVTCIPAMIQQKPGHSFESLKIGDSYDFHRFISEDDVLTFAQITGDDNPLHVDAEYAKNTRFGDRIVHGIFLLGLISKVLGRDFPGPGSVAVSISCRFLRPVRVNSEVRVSVKIIEKLEQRRYAKVETFVFTDANKKALVGEATIIPPTDPE